MAGSTCAGNQQSSLLGGLAGGEPVHFALASAFAVAVGRHGGEGVPAMILCLNAQASHVFALHRLTMRLSHMPSIADKST